MGVITYFLLAGYTPFDRDSQQAEMEAIIAGVRISVDISTIVNDTLSCIGLQI
jgi:hypothetical protein